MNGLMTPSTSPNPDFVANPHDAYAKSVFRRLPHARGLFRAYLPDEVAALFDWRTLQLETESFLVGSSGQKGYAASCAARYTIS